MKRAQEWLQAFFGINGDQSAERGTIGMYVILMEPQRYGIVAQSLYLVSIYDVPALLF